MKRSKLRFDEKAVLSYPEASRLLRVPIEYPVPGLPIAGFSIDTRALQPGELFVALKGERTDGHDHAAEAYEKGASGILIDVRKKAAVFARLQKSRVNPRNILTAADPERTMAELAVQHRSRLTVKTIGITGSVGKTTTKEFLYFLLRQKYPVIATEGNLNNHLGVPIMLSRLRADHQFAVMELGASHVGEIAYLSSLIKPSGAVLTPVGAAHLAGFGSLENVYRAKTEIAGALKEKDPLVVPEGDKRLREFLEGQKCRIVTVGYSDRADLRIGDVVTGGGAVKFTVNGTFRFSFPAQAPFLVLNAGLAIAMAAQFGIRIEEMPCDWKDAGFAAGRFRETILPGGIRIIDDSYNASPLSFFRGLEAFEEIPCTGKKVLVFADMLELGAEEDRFHRELGEKIGKCRIDLAFAYGDRSRVAVEAASRDVSAVCEMRHFKSADELAGHLKGIVRSGDLVFLKGSRGMHVERVLERMKEPAFSNL